MADEKKTRGIELGTAQKSTLGDDEDTVRRASMDSEEFDREKAKLIYTYPLIYYKRNVRKQKGNARDPVQIVLPCGTVSIGLSLAKDVHDSAPMPGAEEKDPMGADNMTVFSYPGSGQQAKLKLLLLALGCMMAVTAGYSVFLAYQSSDVVSNPNRTATGTFVDWLTCACTIINSIFGMVTALLKNERLFHIFVCVYYLDSFLNLFRPDGGYMLIHFLLQQLVLQLASMFQNATRAQWDVPMPARD